MVKKLNQSQLKKIMKLEIKRLMDEDALFLQKNIPGDYDYDVSNFQKSRSPSIINNLDHEEYECDVCSSKKHSIDCECDVCSMQNVGIFESCGCGSSSYEKDIDYTDPQSGHAQIDDISAISPDSIFGIGMQAGRSGEFDDHERSSYMARPQLAKISKYASHLLDMIDENEQLEDWQESKIAQISQMIGDVYHSIEYDEEYEEDEDLILSNLI
jgi:hypothetical protein